MIALNCLAALAVLALHARRPHEQQGGTSAVMRQPQKITKALVLLLTMNSGCADAISFLALGQVLTAAMTGNTVFLGLALVGAKHFMPQVYLVAILSFMAGAAWAAFVVRGKRHVTGLNETVLTALWYEEAMLLIFAILAFAMPDLPADLFVFLLAFSMGVQGATARRLGVNGVPTTVITSTSTGLMEYLVWHPIEVREQRNQRGQSKPSTDFRPSIWLWASDIVLYAAGAAASGFLELRVGLRAIVLPLIIIGVVALWSRTALRHEKRIEHPDQ